MEVVNSETDRRRGGRMDMNRDRSDRSDVSMGNWRSDHRSDLPEPERRGGSGFNRDRDNFRDGKLKIKKYHMVTVQSQ